MEGIRRVTDQPGFRDWPDGFRIFTDEVGRVFWSEGFERGPDGADVALAGDPSGRDGTDDGLAEWGADESRDIAEWEAYLARWDKPDNPAPLWSLYHYKITETNDQSFEDMGMKFLGYFATRKEAESVRDRLAGKPGFRDWPGGFRLYPDGLDADHWLEGFTTEYD
ncbi:MAG TPA: hypothetical protein VD970_02055 [Acetobacteraceae bacterium]|nr:hypothetical protein [Acetobacteraceae bacterium]